MKTFVVGAAGILIGFLIAHVVQPQNLKDAWDSGYKTGSRDALSLNPVSQELEMICAGLWFGDEGKKYWKAKDGR